MFGTVKLFRLINQIINLYILFHTKTIEIEIFATFWKRKIQKALNNY